jgi:HlyD family secretion protein
VSGTGQVASGEDIELKPGASGDLTYLGVANGQEVKAGMLVAQLDAREAQKSVRDAEANLESARIALRKLEEPADPLDLVKAENTLARAGETKTSAEIAIVQTYEKGFNTVADAFLDLPMVMTGLQDILYGTNSGLDINSQNLDAYTTVIRRYDDVKALQYRDDADRAYQSARTAYDRTFDRYKATTRLSTQEEIDAIIRETYESTRAIAEASKSASNLIQLYRDLMTEHDLRVATISDTHLSALSSYTGDTNGHLLSLLSITDSIASSKTAIANADRTIAESQGTLADLRDGTDALDLESARLSVRQRENALQDARETLADYFVRAPFAGTIAKVNVGRYESVTSGTSIATLISKEKIAEIALNEVDVAKIRVGQKTTLTFDAIEDLALTGQVVELDTVGTVSQGVVTYTVKIRLDVDDERVRPGMSVSANIVTEIHQDVLAVPASAVKTDGDRTYVLVLEGELPAVGSGTGVQGIVPPLPPREVDVVVGLSSDTMTEIVSGVEEGTAVVTRTIAGTTNATTNTTPSLLGGSGGGGTGVRIPR